MQRDQFKTNRNHRTITCIHCLLIICILLVTGKAHAASAIPPTENIHYLAEHLVEAVRDACYFSLPWTLPGDDPGNRQSGWEPVVAVAGPVRTVPLDFPEYATFSNPQGKFIHTGLGLVTNIAIGDAYLMSGVGLYDRQTHLEYEIGALITCPVYERLIHEGVDNSLMLSVIWRGK